jgi:hypothetical protein
VGNREMERRQENYNIPDFGVRMKKYSSTEIDGKKELDIPFWERQCGE